MKSLVLTLAAAAVLIGGALVCLQGSALRSAEDTIRAGGFQ